MNPSDRQADLRIIAMPHVFSTERGRIDVQRPSGGSVNDIIRSIGWTPDSLSARVFIDGEYVKDAAWEYTVPRAGQSVIVRAIPTGGQGGGKDTVRIIAVIAIILVTIAISRGALAPVAGSLAGSGGWAALVGGSTASAVVASAVSITATLAVSGLIPAPLPRRALPQPVPEPRLQEAA